MHIYFITNSIRGSKNANSIQTENMYLAFKQLGISVISFWFSYSKIPFLLKGDLFIPCIRFKAPVLGLVSAIFVFIHSRFSRDYLVISRNYYALIFLRIFGMDKLVFEIHSIPKQKSTWLFNKVVNSRKVQIIAITDSLAEKLKSGFEIKNSITVLPDAHPISKTVILERLSAVKPHQTLSGKKETKLKVGYYGSLKDYKGFGIVEKLILDHCQEIDFIIRSKEELSDDLKSKTLKNGYLPHSEALEEMRECSCLLLPLVSTKKFNDISDVTSPLKLFEYLASGRPIIASRAKVLREILTEEVNCLMADDTAEFYSKIKLVGNDKVLRNKLVSNGLQDSLRYSYEERAWKISSIMES